jgi:LemA protein
LNNAVESFPSNIIASQFGFECGEFFEVESAAREVVKVDFN